MKALIFADPKRPEKTPGSLRPADNCRRAPRTSTLASNKRKLNASVTSQKKALR
jgi:hypothetical protein